MAQICTKSFVGWGFAPDPLAGLRGGTPGEGEKGGEGKGGKGVGGIATPPPGRERRKREWREGWGGREGEELSIHGLKLEAPPMVIGC